jgi:putative MATE family efflux protein
MRHEYRSMVTDLTTGSVSRHLRVQATPMALGLVAIISFDVVDLFFVSRLGDAPLAAISFTFPVIWFLGSVAIGYEAGAASCISRAAGEGNAHRAARLTTDAALLAGLATLVLCAIGLMTIDPVFSALGATDELMPLITDYMSIWYWTEPASAVGWTCLASMRARGNTALEGKVITASAILNAILDPIFIFGWFGFPRLEIAGAALASLTATLTMLAFTLIYLATRLRVFANPFVALEKIFGSWRQLMRIGVPAMMTNAIIPVANGIVMAIVATYGVTAVAGFGIAMRIEPVALIPFYALSAVSSPFFGQNISAGKYDRLVEARRVISRFCLRFGLLLAAALCLIAKPLSAVFTQSMEIREVAVD